MSDLVKELHWFGNDGGVICRDKKDNILHKAADRIEELESRKYYTVHAYRWGDRENHSYLVGLYSNQDDALQCAEDEADWRGGKYDCEVNEWIPDSKAEDGSPGMTYKVIKPLPEQTVESFRDGLSIKEKLRNEIKELESRLKWIPVSELPNDNREVEIAFWDGCYMCRIFGIYDHEAKDWYSNGFPIIEDVERKSGWLLTHWREPYDLPPAPDGE